MGQSSSVEMNTEPSDKVNGFQGNVNNMSINQEKEKPKGPRPMPSGDFRTMPLTAWQKIHSNFEGGSGKDKTLRATAPEWTPSTAPIFPPLDAQWSVPVSQTSTGGQSGNGTSHTPEAGSRRPSYTPFGYPGAPPVHAPPHPEQVLQQMMMQKAFYDGWVDAAARASGTMPPGHPTPVTPPLTPAVQTPVLGGVAASLNAHVQAMQAAQGQPPSPARQVAPVSPGALPNTPSQASTGDLSWHQRDPQVNPVPVPAGGVSVSGKDSPRSSILKLCGAWGALQAPPAPPKPTIRLATDKGFARARAELLSFRRPMERPKELATLGCAKV